MIDIIDILLYRPGAEPMVVPIEADLSVMQQIVGGWIEARHITDDIAIICNEEGKLQGLPINRSGIVGTFFVTKHNEEGDEISLDPEDVQFAKNWIANNYVG